jgi:DNA-binding transcriptional regulator YiaG
MDLSAAINRGQARRALPPPVERRAIREAARVSVSELASVLGVADITLARWERGEWSPRGDAVIRYAEALAELRDVGWRRLDPAHSCP